MVFKKCTSFSHYVLNVFFNSFSECDDLTRNLAYPQVFKQLEKYGLTYSPMITVHCKNSTDLRTPHLFFFLQHLQYASISASISFWLKESIHLLFNSLHAPFPQLKLLTLYSPNTYLTNKAPDWAISFQRANGFIPARLNTILGNS